VISTVALCLNTLTQFQYVDASGNLKVFKRLQHQKTNTNKKPAYSGEKKLQRNISTLKWSLETLSAVKSQSWVSS
jgi:hypothetical protein